MPSINDLSFYTRIHCQKLCKEAGVDIDSPVTVALVSGLDVALTIMEESLEANFRGLSAVAASRMTQYFKAEAQRNMSLDPRIGFYYEAWAKVIEEHYLEKPSSE